METVRIEHGPSARMDEPRLDDGIHVGETIAGAGAVVLSILGLVGLVPVIFLSIVTLVIGGIFLMASGSIVTRLSHTNFETGEMALGMTTEFIGGMSGIALGVLSLLGLAPGVLLPVAAMVFGFTLLFGLGIQSRLNEVEMQERCERANETVRKVAHEATSATLSILVFFGIGAFTLGILSLVGLAPLTLTLISMLSVATATFFINGAPLFVRTQGLGRLCELPA